jgi:hypothetical protein
MIGKIPLRPRPDGIQWLGTTAWRFELEWGVRFSLPRSGWATPEKAAGDMSQERMEAPVQDIRPAVEEDQAVKATRKLMAEEVASGLEAETGNTQGSSSAEPEAEVVGGGGIARGEGYAEGEKEGAAAVG